VDEAWRRLQHGARRAGRRRRLLARSPPNLFGAGLDVTGPTLPPSPAPRARRRQVTPHVASATGDGKVRIFRAAFEQVVMAGRPAPVGLVNPEVWAATTAKG
jgi:phosphoglycerate dehydrogenase-like enzyme